MPTSRRAATAPARSSGYHSNRRVPDRAVLETQIIPLYKRLLAEEQRHSNRKEGLKASVGILTSMLEEKKMAYDEFIATLAAAA